MKKTNTASKEKMVRKTYHLPERVTNWIADRADTEERSASNFLTKLVKGIMKGGA